LPAQGRRNVKRIVTGLFINSFISYYLTGKEIIRQGVVANMLNVFRNRAVDFIDWFGRECKSKARLSKT